MDIVSLESLSTPTISFVESRALHLNGAQISKPPPQVSIQRPIAAVRVNVQRILNCNREEQFSEELPFIMKPNVSVTKKDGVNGVQNTVEVAVKMKVSTSKGQYQERYEVSDGRSELPVHFQSLQKCLVHDWPDVQKLHFVQATVSHTASNDEDGMELYTLVTVYLSDGEIMLESMGRGDEVHIAASQAFFEALMVYLMR